MFRVLQAVFILLVPALASAQNYFFVEGQKFETGAITNESTFLFGGRSERIPYSEIKDDSRLKGRIHIDPVSEKIIYTDPQKRVQKSVTTWDSSMSTTIIYYNLLGKDSVVRYFENDTLRSSVAQEYDSLGRVILMRNYELQSDSILTEVQTVYTDSITAYGRIYTELIQDSNPFFNKKKIYVYNKKNKLIRKIEGINSNRAHDYIYDEKDSLIAVINTYDEAKWIDSIKYKDESQCYNERVWHLTASNSQDIEKQIRKMVRHLRKNLLACDDSRFTFYSEDRLHQLVIKRGIHLSVLNVAVYTHTIILKS